MSDTTISGPPAIEPSPRLYNEDLAPARERKWGTYSLFAMWMSDVHSIGGYTFAAGLFFTGLVGWQVFVALVLGITVVFFLMNLTGFAGQATGVPRGRRPPRPKVLRPRHARLGGVRGSLGAAAPGHPARHGNGSPVPGLGGSGYLGCDVRARRVDRDRGRIGLLTEPDRQPEDR